MKKTKIDHYTDKEALDFHSQNKPGKIEINSSKPMTTKRDLALAYSPGVAVPVRIIAEKKDAKIINNKKGNVILVNVIANSIFCESFSNPGAIRSTNNGISISMMIINKSKPKISKLKILLAKFSDNFFLFNIDE